MLALVSSRSIERNNPAKAPETYSTIDDLCPVQIELQHP